MSVQQNGIVALRLENAGAADLEAGVATFGQVFAQGEVGNGSHLTASIGGVDVAVQMDVKTRWADGSVKQAVVSVARPDLQAGSSAEVVLNAAAGANQAAAVDMNSVLANHSFAVDLTGGSSPVHVDVLDVLRTALANGTADFWQQGELATQARVSVDLPGSQRLVFDVTAYKGGGMSVEAQFNNDAAMITDGGRASCNVQVTMDGHVAANESVSQGLYQNWHQSFDTGVDGGQGTGSPEAGWLNIHQDISHLADTGAVAQYDLSTPIPEADLAALGTAAAAAGTDTPLAVNGVTQYMPGTGGRADIGFTTETNTTWLITQDARAAAYALDQAETASSVPWNMWDAANGKWLSADDYPKLWTDPRGGTGAAGDANSGSLTQQSDGDTGWNLDSAHQPDLSYVPYLMTGERWMLDNLQAQAAWNVESVWTAQRGDDGMLVVQDNQVRGAAWSLRQIDEAAYASPDGSAEKAYFTEVSNANWSWLVSKIPEWTAQQGEAHGYLPGEYGAAGALPPWQQDYFASTAIAAASQGNADALTFLKWEANFLVGRFTHAAEGFAEHDGAAYLIANADATTGTPYTTWAEIGAQTVARGWSNGDGWEQSQGDYPQLALATLAGIARLTGSQEAVDAYNALVADGAPFTTQADYAQDPTFAIEAPGAAGSVTPVNTGSSTTPVTGAAAPATDPVTSTDPVAVTDPATADPVKEPATGTETGQTGTDQGDNTPASSAAGQDGLSIVLGAEAWQGNPVATVMVDGEVRFRGEVTATHASGGEAIDLGNYAAGSDHVVTVTYDNDAWGGTAEADRNLYVEDIVAGGIKTGSQGDLLNSGTLTFRVETPSTETAAAAPAETPTRTPTDTTAETPATTPVAAPTDAQASVPSVGEGDHVIRLGLSEDAFGGDAHFALELDGKQIIDSRAVTASHSMGDVEMLDILTSVDLSKGDHQLSVQFLDDHWGGSADQDRNLYVDSIRVDGTDLQHSAALTNNGDALFSI
ncbi:carbohydrate-binding domain-containing protein [Roseomonas elaeocarpi]|uniref:Carbohydrate-binding domain-containing protein n=1 Tax=Roseomonas elaeocarpi TaxID=907779 RepID=A0ABV6JLS4_9PROT